MKREAAPDHYAVLGLPADADAAAVRAAYLRLIKRSHPDRVGERPDAGPSASALNEAYAVLKDPERRRAYDLGRRSGLPAPVVIVPRRAPVPRRWPGIGWWLGLPVLLALSWIAFLLGQRAYEQSVPRIVPPDFSDAPATPEEGEPGPPSGWVDAAIVDQAVDNLVALRAAGHGADVERYSRTCFEQFEVDPTPLRADHCIAFDVAAATLRPRGGAATPAPDLAARHAAMLRRVVSEPVAVEMRLREIRAETVSAIARRMAPSLRPVPPRP